MGRSYINIYSHNITLVHTLDNIVQNRRMNYFYIFMDFFSLHATPMGVSSQDDHPTS